jgi:hypothetical protein
VNGTWLQGRQSGALRTAWHISVQASGVFVYDAHFPVPLLGRVSAAEALALAAPYGRPATVPGDSWRSAADRHLGWQLAVERRKVHNDMEGVQAGARRRCSLTMSGASLMTAYIGPGCKGTV